MDKKMTAQVFLDRNNYKMNLVELQRVQDKDFKFPINFMNVNIDHH